MSQFERFLAKHLKELNDLKGYESTRFRLSDSRSFGEGEHKIMKEIRALKKDTSIAIYGLDADLIILGISVSQ
jgi:5'-3' exonuclease